MNSFVGNDKKCVAVHVRASIALLGENPKKDSDDSRKRTRREFRGTQMTVIRVSAIKNGRE